MASSIRDRAKTLYIKRCGNPSGPMVLFLHGIGTSSWMWESVVDRLPDIDALLVDLPGHGRSCSTPWYSLEETAQLVWEAIESRHEARAFHLAGASLGAYVALILLCSRPDHFRTAMLSGLHIGNMPNPVMMKLMSRAVSPFVTWPLFARRTARALGIPESDTERFVHEAGMTSPASFRKASIDAVNFEAPVSMESIQAETVFAAGSREHPLILSSLDEFCQSVPHSRTMIVPDAGHGWSCEKPQRFADSLRALIFGSDAVTS